MQEKSLRQKLIIIISTIFVLPSLVLCYIFYEQHVTLSPSNVALFFLIMVLAVIGIMLVRYVFDAVSTTADFLKIATEGGEKLSLNLHQEAAKLNEISSSFNRMIERFEKNTESLNQTKEALHASEEKYRNIIEHIEEGYYEVDLAGNFTFFNTPVSQILGYSVEELKRMNNRQYMDKENSKKVFLDYSEVYRTDIPKKNLDAELIKKDGKKVYVGISISLIRDSLGQPIGFRGIIHDITERKRAEEALQKSEKEYRTLVDNASDIIFRTDETGHFTFVNPATLRITGYKEKEIAGRHYPALIRPDMRDETIKFFGRQFVKGIQNTYLEYPILTKEGHEEGDKALIEAATVFKETFRTSDIIARLGGDEYAALAIDINEANSEIFTARLQSLIDTRNNQENRRYRLSISVGCSYYDPENPCSIDELMASADKLMYEQKQNKKGLLLQGGGGSLSSSNSYPSMHDESKDK